MKKLNYIYVLVALLCTTFHSCDEETDDSVPNLAPTAEVVITTSPSSDSQCNVDITFTVAQESTVYYIPVTTASFAGTDSDDLFSQGTAITFEEAGSSSITLEGLPEGLDLTIGAISVNEDGTRSNQVFTERYVQPSYDVLTDTSYSGDIEVPLFGIGLGVFEPYTVTMTPVSGQSNTYSIDTAWGPNFLAQLAGAPEGFGPYPATLVINSDYTIDVTSIEPYGTGGTGAYDPCTNVITFTIDQFFFGAPNDFTTDVTLVPNNL